MGTRKVFIASPSDLQDERTLVKEISRDLNKENENTRLNKIEIVDGFKQTPQIGRAQSVINDILRGCDYCIVMLKNNWGTPPSADSVYSSGTEEEFFEALKCVIDQKSPMKNISVIFFAGDSSISKEVKVFKDKLRESYSFLYDDVKLGEESEKIEAVLKNLNKTSRGSHHDFYNITTLSNEAVLKPVLNLQRGRDAFNTGDGVLAEEYFGKAAEEGGIPEKLELVKFYRHSGQLEKAQKEIDSLKDVIINRHGFRSKEYLLLMEEQIKSSNSNEKIETIIYALEQNIIADDDIPAVDTEDFARLYDLLGHYYRRNNELSEAKYYFEKSHAFRKETNKPVELFMSYLNLATIEHDLQNIGEAHDYLRQAEPYIKHADRNKKARFYLSRAQVLLKNNDFGSARTFAQKSLSLNQASGYKQGQAYSLTVLSNIEECCGNSLNAIKFLKESLNINIEIKHEDGIKLIKQRIDDLHKNTKD